MATARRGRRGHRLGLALAGGGAEGAVYEIGALRALEEAIEGLDLNTIHVYVGVSAGAFVAAALANGQTTSQLVRGLVKRVPGENPYDAWTFFTPAYGDWVRRGIRVPALAGDLLLQGLREPWTVTRSLLRLSRVLPLGLFDNEPIRRFLARAFSRPGRTDDFRRLRQKLFVVAADLEAGVPIVFGRDGWDHIPISTAVQASTAVPGVYSPVEIEGRLCVDGVLLKTVHASVALEEGADLLLCVNPLVPVDVAAGEQRGALRPGSLVRYGLPAIMSQTFRTLIHSRMVVGMARYRSRFPRADVALFEPDRDEYRLFFSNVFSFRARREICEIGYRATRRDLWRRRAVLAPMFRRHGLRLREERLRDLDRSVWDGVGLGHAKRGAPVSAQLAEALTRLEASLATR